MGAGSSRPGSSDTNRIPALIDCAVASATIGGSAGCSGRSFGGTWSRPSPSLADDPGTVRFGTLRYSPTMYLDALSFLEDEREGWRAYEALDELTDAESAPQLDSVHGWSGRDLMAHMVAWLEVSLDVARELTVNDISPTKAAADADWDARGDVLNEEIRLSWLALPMDEVRRRFRSVPGELRASLALVPETRWIKSAEYEQFFRDETIDHYASHRDDLAAVLASAGR